MTETRKRDPLPPLEYPNPVCPLDHKTTEFDGDGFTCPECRGSWSTQAGDEGEGDYDTEQCPAEIAPYADHERDSMRVMRFRCVRNEGHPAGKNDYFEYHVGVRCDGEPDYIDCPREWKDGED